MVWLSSFACGKIIGCAGGDMQSHQRGAVREVVVDWWGGEDRVRTHEQSTKKVDENPLQTQRVMNIHNSYWQ